MSELTLGNTCVNDILGLRGNKETLRRSKIHFRHRGITHLTSDLISQKTGVKGTSLKTSVNRGVSKNKSIKSHPGPETLKILPLRLHAGFNST